MRREKKQKISTALLGASLFVMILGLLALAAGSLSPPHRSMLMWFAQALSLCGLIAFMAGWRLLLNRADPEHIGALQWWSMTVVLVLLMGMAYWAWVGGHM